MRLDYKCFHSNSSPSVGIELYGKRLILTLTEIVLYEVIFNMIAYTKGWVKVIALPLTLDNSTTREAERSP